MSRVEEAIKALTQLLSHSPTDGESWSKLADLYFSQGLYPQAVFSLEEVLLIHPNAYNIHARIAETLYVSGENTVEALTDAMRYYCRSVELCQWYLRGWYGLKIVTGQLLKINSGKGANLGTVEKLNLAATSRLEEIIHRSRAREKGWAGFHIAEIDAAAELVKDS